MDRTKPPTLRNGLPVPDQSEKFCTEGERSATALFTNAQVIGARDSYANGVSVEELAALFGTTRVNMYKIVTSRSYRCVRMGIRTVTGPPPLKVDPYGERNAKIKALFDQGKTVKEIAAELGVTRSVAYGALTKMFKSGSGQ